MLVSKFAAKDIVQGINLTMNLRYRWPLWLGSASHPIEPSAVCYFPQSSHHFIKSAGALSCHSRPAIPASHLFHVGDEVCPKGINFCNCHIVIGMAYDAMPLYCPDIEVAKFSASPRVGSSRD
jgi:hypothetical protein